MDKNKSYGNIISTQELKAHLQDNNKARMYEEKKLQKVMKEYAKTVTKEQKEKVNDE